MDMTVQKCLKICRKRGFQFSGLQWQIECYCGNVPSKEFQWAWPERCDDRCAGDSNQICGGSMAMSLYNTPERDPKGLCVYDHPEKRVLDGKSATGLNDLTIEKCSNFCSSYKFFGLQGGNECHCGDYDDNFLPSSQLECNLPCTGGYQICGGSWRMNVFLNRDSKFLTPTLPSNLTMEAIDVYTTIWGTFCTIIALFWSTFLRFALVNMDTFLNHDSNFLSSTLPSIPTIDAIEVNTTISTLTLDTQTTAASITEWKMPYTDTQTTMASIIEWTRPYAEDATRNSGWSLLSYNQISEEHDFQISEEDVNYGSDENMFVLSDQMNDFSHDYFTYFSSETYRDRGYATPSEFDDFSITTNSPSLDTTAQMTQTVAYPFRRSHRDTTEAPTRQPLMEGILCSSYHCDASRWMSRDSPAGTGDHERFE